MTAPVLWVSPNNYNNYGSGTLTNQLVPGTSTGPAIGSYVVGFVDSQRSHFFYSSNANSITLPQLVAPNIVNANFVGCGTTNAAINGFSGNGASVFALSDTGSDYGTGGTIPTGVAFYSIYLQYAPGSPDAGSPAQFYLDNYALLIVTTVAGGAEGA